jgi:hypothetical protein
VDLQKRTADFSPIRVLDFCALFSPPWTPI